MILLLQILFWCCILAVGYTYFFFPMLIKKIAKGKLTNSICFTKDDQLPVVAIIMSVFNEEKVLAEKLNSVLELNYPLNRIHFFIGNDASTDSTSQILQQHQAKFENFNVVNNIIQSGKTSFINKLSKMAKNKLGDEAIFILTDANVMLEKDLCFELVKHFKNPKIGIVGANVMNTSHKESAVADMETMYISRENEIKFNEGLLNGAMMGAFGACYAIKASAIKSVPEHFLMEDFYITMQVHNQQLQCIMEPKAICYEDVPGNMLIEFKRKSRIAAGNFQNFFQFTNWLFKPFSAVGFAYISHKVLRWLTPFLAIISIVLVAILSNYYLVYYYIFWYKFLFWIFFFGDIVLVYFNIHIKPLRMLTYFYFMNVAILIGFFNFLKGIKTSAWKPTDRNVKE
ncbi:MAG: hypothetical protein RJA07_2454 [Bacteroidota bacterium]|jgi:cellulose synthase/poly-beta-1,6-N-acetylglucosamine synthase-like glycosyltransferase